MSTILPPTDLIFTSDAAVAPSGYQPGVCNIGPAEIARRRRAGHVGLVATAAAFAVLGILKAPPAARLALALPASAAAAGYLQAHFRFCAGFGAAGVQNFDSVGTTVPVADADARSRDRAQATRIGLASVAVGSTVGILAAIAARR